MPSQKLTITVLGARSAGLSTEFIDRPAPVYVCHIIEFQSVVLVFATVATAGKTCEKIFLHNISPITQYCTISTVDSKFLEFSMSGTPDKFSRRFLHTSKKKLAVTCD
jgi:hypothetical protein